MSCLPILQSTKPESSALNAILLLETSFGWWCFFSHLNVFRKDVYAASKQNALKNKCNSYINLAKNRNTTLKFLSELMWPPGFLHSTHSLHKHMGSVLNAEVGTVKSLEQLFFPMLKKQTKKTTCSTGESRRMSLLDFVSSGFTFQMWTVHHKY